MRVHNRTSRLYWAIRQGMYYWFARLILEKTFVESRAFADGRSVKNAQLTNTCLARAYKKRRYWALKGQGLTPAQAKARMDGTSVAHYAAQARQRARRRKDRWGGQASNVGSPVWQRWILRDIPEV